MKKILMFIIGLASCFILGKVYAYDTYEIGDRVIFRGESYHVIKNSDSNKSYVTILRDNSMTFDEINEYGRENDKLFVNQYHLNFDDPEHVIYDFGNDVGGVAYYSREDCKFAITSLSSVDTGFEDIRVGCSSAYQTSDLKKLVDNWANQFGDSLVKINGLKARLLYASEFINDFSIETYAVNSCYVYNGNIEYSWLYKNAKKYWVIYDLDDSNKTAYMDSTGTLRMYNFDYYNSVRPVINVLKSRLGDFDKFEYNTYKEYKQGDEVVYKDTEFYVIEDSDKYSDYLYLLRKNPLDSEQIKKYSNNTYDSDYGEVPFCHNLNCSISDKSGCNNDYNNSILKNIIDNYISAELDSNDLISLDGYSGKLLSVNDLLSNENLNFYDNINDKELLNVPQFLLPQNDKDYWLLSSNPNSYLASILSNKTIKNVNVYETNFVRPVIYLKKSALKSEIEEDNKDNTCKTQLVLKKEITYRSYNIGDKIKYNGEYYYVIDKSGIKQDYVTLLKENLLTSEEVLKYDTNSKELFKNNIGVVNYNYDASCTASDNSSECNNNYDNSFIKIIVDKWVSSELNEDDLVSFDGYKSRLLRYNEMNEYAEYNNTNYYYFIMDGRHAGFKSKSMGDSDLFYKAVRPVINLKKSVLGSINTYNVGDIVTYKNEEYYIIQDSSSDMEYVTVLKKNPLNQYQIYLYTNNNVGASPYYISDVCINRNIYGLDIETLDYNNELGKCISDFKQSYIKGILDNWADDKFNLDELATIDGYKVRLITTEEMFMNLGYDANNIITLGSSSLKVVPTVPEWMYNINSYWTMSEYQDVGNSVYYIEKNGNAYLTNILFSFKGVRPVINLKKNAIENGYIYNEYYVCEDDNNDSGDSEIISVSNTFRSVSIIVSIICGFLILIGTIILVFNYKISKNNKK